MKHPICKDTAHTILNNLARNIMKMRWHSTTYSFINIQQTTSLIWPGSCSTRCSLRVDVLMRGSHNTLLSVESSFCVGGALARARLRRASPHSIGALYILPSRPKLAVVAARVWARPIQRDDDACATSPRSTCGVPRRALASAFRTRPPSRR